MIYIRYNRLYILRYIPKRLQLRLQFSNPVAAFFLNPTIPPRFPYNKEVDFVVCNQNKAEELIQVAYDIDSDKTFRRETNSLIKASTALNCDNLTLIAFSETRDVEMDGKCIHIFSAIDWLLRED